jgi:hypothetical protein
MSKVYTFTLDDETSAKALIYNYKLASLRLVKHLPKMEMKLLESDNVKIARFRWVGIGKKYYHPVYVFLKYNEEKDVFILINKPKYPAYLLGFIGSMVMVGMHPAVLINTVKDVRAVVTSDYEKALLIANEGLKHGAISGRKFLDFEDISYEGYLYEVPIGYVAFLEEKPPFHPYDIIVDHAEYDEWVHAIDIVREVVLQIIGRTMG